MNHSSRLAAFLAYLFSLPGALVVLLTQRNDPFARHHARQSLVIALAAIGTPLPWAVCAWALAWIPKVGAMLGVALFSLVIVAGIVLAVCWVAGMVFALQGVLWTMPLLGRWVAPRRRPAAITPLPEAVERL